VVSERALGLFQMSGILRAPSVFEEVPPTHPRNAPESVPAATSAITRSRRSLTIYGVFFISPRLLHDCLRRLVQ
jgi:hypothetical protein